MHAHPLRSSASLITVGVVALAMSGVITPSAFAAQEDSSEAYARIAISNQEDKTGIDWAVSESGYPSSPEAVYTLSDASGNLVPGLSVDETSLATYALADADSATASAGAITEDGEVSDDPSKDVITLDLAQYIEDAGLDPDDVGSATLQVKPLASTVHTELGKDATTDYRVDGGILTVDSPVITDQINQLIEQIEGPAQEIWEKYDTPALNDLIDAPLEVDVNSDPKSTLSLTVADVELNDLEAAQRAALAVLGQPITDAAGLVTVSPATGTFAVDLSKFDLNGRDPNTHILTSGASDKVADAVADLLLELQENARIAFQKALDTATLKVTFDASITTVGVDEPATATVTVSGSVSSYRESKDESPTVAVSDIGGSVIPTLTAVGKSPQDFAAIVQQKAADKLTSSVRPKVQDLADQVREAIWAVIDLVPTRDELHTSFARLMSALEDNVIDIVVNYQPGTSTTTFAADTAAGASTVSALSITLRPGSSDESRYAFATSSARTGNPAEEPTEPTEPTEPSEPTAPTESPKPSSPTPTPTATPTTPVKGAAVHTGGDVETSSDSWMIAGGALIALAGAGLGWGALHRRRRQS